MNARVTPSSRDVAAEMPGVALICGDHPDAGADFQCASCEALLCGRCVTAAGELYVCKRCGERAFPLDHYEEPEPYRAPLPGAGEDRTLEGFAAQVAHHLVVPVAIMTMVGGFLFFLVDVRSVYLPLGLALKWVGFCFILATVLTARYGKQTDDTGRQGCYTVALGLAMALVLWVSPWDRNASVLTILVNMGIVFLVWRFATRLTMRLGREGERPAPRKKKFYGVERLELKAWKRDNQGAVGSLKDKASDAVEKKEKEARAGKGTGADAHGNPSASVARLAALALVVIALCEPVLLAGAPEVGIRALAALLFFVFGTALVLGTGSAVGALRTIRDQGGQVSETVVPWRLAVATLTTMTVLCLALAVPGVTYRGRGEIEQARAPGEHRGIVPSDEVEGEGSGRGDVEGESPEKGGQSGEGETGEGGKSADHQGQDGGNQGQEGDSSSRSGNPASMASSLLQVVAGIGKLLWIPFVLLLIFGGLWLLHKLGPFLWARRNLLSGWRAKLLGLLARLSRTPERAAGRRRKALRPIDFGALGRMSPSAAVVESYLCLLDRLEALGYERREDRAPYEYVNGLPRHLVHLEQPLTGVTALYVRAAYGGEGLTETDRAAALRVLKTVDAQVGRP